MLITSYYNVCSMGSSTSRLYSALAQTLSSAPTARAAACPEEEEEEEVDVEPCSPDDLLKECEEVLRNRPARLHRSFIFPKDPAPQNRPIRVMQWNVLAQALGEGKDSFVQCPLEALNWAERKYLILEEILTYRPDVLCLQEVDHYFDTFQPVLRSLGYHGTFCPKPWSPCLDVECNNGPDGCALFFSRDRFELLDSASVRLAAAMLKTNQVAIVQKLRDRATGRPLCVAVTHLKARSGWERLRSAQGSDLLQNLQVATGGHAGMPLLVCGDFNAEPSEDVYRRFASSSLGLDSAYKQLSADGQTEPPYTTWKIRPSGEVCHTLDYIWYSRCALSVNAVLDFPTAEQIGPNRLPSYNYPSDHLSLVCDFSFLDEPDRLM
ncbi:nocturnin-like isoform X2 [Megalops cyprinoides]|uniref:nocturnin-like isoform X2 n=1 Tax=Megalops cyprinoides TaxID=118141 RepID=UPI0018643E9C|nr:nocturnin-like isoform X2 [Megalops cyprinoides]